MNTPEPQTMARRYHVSSAVIAVMPDQQTTVISAVRIMPGVQLHGSIGNRLIITIEGWSTGELGDRLTQISTIKGVIAANMVFEHSEHEETKE